MFWKMVLAVSVAWLVIPAAAWILVNQLMRFVAFLAELKASQLQHRSRIVNW